MPLAAVFCDRRSGSSIGVLPLAGGFMPSRPDTLLAGRPRSAIIVDEWDLRLSRLRSCGPLTAPGDSVASSHSGSGRQMARCITARSRLGIVGKRNHWRYDCGCAKARLAWRLGADARIHWDIDDVAEGVVLPARIPYPFSYSRFEPPIDWTTRFFKWSDSTGDPRRLPTR